MSLRTNGISFAAFCLTLLALTLPTSAQTQDSSSSVATAELPYAPSAQPSATEPSPTPAATGEAKGKLGFRYALGEIVKDGGFGLEMVSIARILNHPRYASFTTMCDTDNAFGVVIATAPCKTYFDYSHIFVEKGWTTHLLRIDSRNTTGVIAANVGLEVVISAGLYKMHTSRRSSVRKAATVLTWFQAGNRFTRATNNEIWVSQEEHLFPANATNIVWQDTVPTLP